MTTIYIRLLEEGTEVFRPTAAEPIGSQFFKVLRTANYDEEDEVWEFAPGSAVECERRQLEGAEVLVAIKHATALGAYTP
jgi:hypothetical protein